VTISAWTRELHPPILVSAAYRPTELDAYVFGHLFTLLTTELPDVDIGEVVKKYENLKMFTKRVETIYFSRAASTAQSKHRVKK
jgi:metaxin